MIGEFGSPEKLGSAQKPGITVEPDHWSLSGQQQEGLTRPTARIFTDSKSTICQCIACGKVIVEEKNHKLQKSHYKLCCN